MEKVDPRSVTDQTVTSDTVEMVRSQFSLTFKGIQGLPKLHSVPFVLNIEVSQVSAKLMNFSLPFLMMNSILFGNI